MNVKQSSFCHFHVSLVPAEPHLEFPWGEVCAQAVPHRLWGAEQLSTCMQARCFQITCPCMVNVKQSLFCHFHVALVPAEPHLEFPWGKVCAQTVPHRLWGAVHLSTCMQARCLPNTCSCTMNVKQSLFCHFHVSLVPAEPHLEFPWGEVCAQAMPHRLWGAEQLSTCMQARCFQITCPCMVNVKQSLFCHFHVALVPAEPHLEFPWGKVCAQTVPHRLWGAVHLSTCMQARCLPNTCSCTMNVKQSLFCHFHVSLVPAEPHLEFPWGEVCAQAVPHRLWGAEQLSTCMQARCFQITCPCMVNVKQSLFCHFHVALVPAEPHLEFPWGKVCAQTVPHRLWGAVHLSTCMQARCLPNTCSCTMNVKQSLFCHFHVSLVPAEPHLEFPWGEVCAQAVPHRLWGAEQLSTCMQARCFQITCPCMVNVKQSLFCHFHVALVPAEPHLEFPWGKVCAQTVPHRLWGAVHLSTCMQARCLPNTCSCTMNVKQSLFCHFHVSLVPAEPHLEFPWGEVCAQAVPHRLWGAEQLSTCMQARCFQITCPCMVNVKQSLFCHFHVALVPAEPHLEFPWGKVCAQTVPHRLWGAVHLSTCMQARCLPNTCSCTMNVKQSSFCHFHVSLVPAEPHLEFPWGEVCAQAMPHRLWGAEQLSTCMQARCFQITCPCMVNVKQSLFCHFHVALVPAEPHLEFPWGKVCAQTVPHRLWGAVHLSTCMQARCLPNTCSCTMNVKQSLFCHFHVSLVPAEPHLEFPWGEVCAQAVPHRLWGAEQLSTCMQARCFQITCPCMVNVKQSLFCHFHVALVPAEPHLEFPWGKVCAQTVPHRLWGAVHLSTCMQARCLPNTCSCTMNVKQSLFCHFHVSLVPAEPHLEFPWGEVCAQAMPHRLWGAEQLSTCMQARCFQITCPCMVNVKQSLFCHFHVALVPAEPHLEFPWGKVCAQTVPHRLWGAVHLSTCMQARCLPNTCSCTMNVKQSSFCHFHVSLVPAEPHLEFPWGEVCAQAVPHRLWGAEQLSTCMQARCFQITCPCMVNVKQSLFCHFHVALVPAEPHLEFPWGKVCAQTVPHRLWGAVHLSTCMQARCLPNTCSCTMNVKQSSFCHFHVSLVPAEPHLEFPWGEVCAQAVPHRLWGAEQLSTCMQARCFQITCPCMVNVKQSSFCHFHVALVPAEPHLEFPWGKVCAQTVPHRLWGAVHLSTCMQARCLPNTCSCTMNVKQSSFCHFHVSLVPAEPHLEFPWGEVCAQAVPHRLWGAEQLSTCMQARCFQITCPCMVNVKQSLFCHFHVALVPAEPHLEFPWGKVCAQTVPHRLWGAVHLSTCMQARCLPNTCSCTMNVKQSLFCHFHVSLVPAEPHLEFPWGEVCAQAVPHRLWGAEQLSTCMQARCFQITCPCMVNVKQSLFCHFHVALVPAEPHLEFPWGKVCAQTVPHRLWGAVHLSTCMQARCLPNTCSCTMNVKQSSFCHFHVSLVPAEPHLEFPWGEVCAQAMPHRLWGAEQLSTCMQARCFQITCPCMVNVKQSLFCHFHVALVPAEPHLEFPWGKVCAQTVPHRLWGAVHLSTCMQARCLPNTCSCTMNVKQSSFCHFHVSLVPAEPHLEFPWGEVCAQAVPHRLWGAEQLSTCMQARCFQITCPCMVNVKQSSFCHFHVALVPAEPHLEFPWGKVCAQTVPHRLWGAVHLSTCMQARCLPNTCSCTMNVKQSLFCHFHVSLVPAEPHLEFPWGEVCAQAVAACEACRTSCSSAVHVLCAEVCNKTNNWSVGLFVARR